MSLWTLVDNEAWRTDATRWTGVVVSLLGAFVVSPSGTVLLARTLWQPFVRAGHALRSLLARWIPSLRPQPTAVNLGPISMGMGLGLEVGATMLAFGPNDETPKKLDILMRNVQDLHTRISRAEGRLDADIAEVAAEVKALERALAAESRSLRAAVVDVERRATETDARALPLVGFGILLGALAGWLAGGPVWLWAAVTLGVLVSAAWLSVVSFREHRATSTP